jgi:membrane protein insertase Oxa1/YidC/SpoIIIJ
VRGYLPFVLQFPILIVLYGTIRGLVHQSVVGGVLTADPLYLSHETRLYNAIAAAHGHLVAFGVNLADSVRTPGIGWEARLPLVALVLVAVALQYIQLKQSHELNQVQSSELPQMQRILKVAPLLLAVVYVSLPAGVSVYFITAGLIRVVQQAVMYPRDPHIRTSLERLRAQTGPG